MYSSSIVEIDNRILSISQPEHCDDMLDIYKTFNNLIYLFLVWLYLSVASGETMSESLGLTWESNWDPE